MSFLDIGNIVLNLALQLKFIHNSKIVINCKDLTRTDLHSSHQTFVPELQLAAGIRLDGYIALYQAAGEVGAFCAGLADAAGRAFSQRTFLAHLTLKPLLAVAALAGHF